MTVYIILLVIGMIAFLFLGRSVLLGQKSRSWPSVAGSILQSGIETHQSTDDDGSISTTYGVSLVYKYTISGQEFQGTRRTFTDVRTSSLLRTQKILVSYPQGGSVTVFYNPDDPSSCVLEPGVGTYIYIVLVLTGVMTLAGLAGLLGLFG